MTHFVGLDVSQKITLFAWSTTFHVRTGLRARASDDFKADTVRWYLSNSEDVGDIAAMLSLAMSVGFGVTGIMLYMFTNENLKQYAVLKAWARPRDSCCR